MYLRQANYVKSALARVGIDVTVRSQDLPSFLKRVYADRQFDFMSIGVNTLFDPSVGVQRLYWSKNIRPGVPFSNAPHYSNAEVDRLLESASIETDESKRVALYQQFQQIVIGNRLTGGRKTLASANPVRTVGSYWPYATTLFDYIRRAMPYNAPQSLSADEVYALSAWILNQNGIVPDDTRLDVLSLAAIRMPNRDGFVRDPRPGRL
jgi:hypothetical protein